MSIDATATPTRYDAVAIALHWTIAGLIVVDFAFALSFGWFNPGDALYFASAYALHMSTGLLILALTLLRVGWRLAHRLPHPPAMGVALQALARLSHALLYAFMLVAPLSGWLILAIRRQVTSVFGLFSWAWPLPVINSLPRPVRQAYHDTLLPFHIDMAYLGMSLVAVHIMAALYHQLRRDGVMTRMLQPGRHHSSAPNSGT